MKTAAQIAYDEIIEASSAALDPNEYWCIAHPDGLLPETRAKDLATPVVTVCDALGQDWDDLKEQGYRLTRCVEKT